ncbi:aspartyl protease family protein At5g10770-like [Phragmites australis]|uniref:aspartyl protease family protein At5g10770-like n=1 Tax=Phragmites australis TaxID=29695 RepID=UPI002D77AF0D|nr:aspartyl protease family protein At5g10770-like [Phragmites australis]
MVPVLPILLLLLPAASFSPVAHAKGRHGHSLKPHAVCSGLRVFPSSNTTWLPLHHRRGPCSPSYSTGSRTSTTTNILRRDQLRADDIRRKLSKKGDVTVSTALGTLENTLEYVVTVELGTPAVSQTLLVDTGSDLSWVQCRPCPVPPCHRQKDVVFDPSKSSTYSSFPCGSPACARLGSQYTNGCSNGQCDYVVKYNDGSNTTGTYSSDTLTMTSSGVVSNFLFGCSHAEQGFSDPDRTDGILGFGGGTQSLVSQTGGRAFSYCLPRTASHTGFLTLGVPHISSSRFAVTPMYRFRNTPTFHVVILQAITVAGRRLGVPPSVFSAGSIMDSGTIITRLPPTAYRALRAAFRAEMKMYPPASPISILDTCFNLTGVRRVMVPRVALGFDRGAAVELHSSGIMQYGCLAFAPNGDDATPGIIGNVQQRTLEVLYDVGGWAVGFRRGAC